MEEADWENLRLIAFLRHEKMSETARWILIPRARRLAAKVRMRNGAPLIGTTKKRS
ncbi:hypothetical protein K2Z84_21555 [Candidatus Binatia bacterium]|nr:hypothetical protein [Candidatus Binatia bacterium]